MARRRHNTRHGLSADAGHRVGRQAIEAIIWIAREVRVAPVAMATHGRTGWRHLLRDRVAGAERHHVPCPMARPALWSMALRKGRGDHKPLHTPMGGRRELFSPWGNCARNLSATTCQPCSVMVPL